MKDEMVPRWKGKGAESRALSDPISKIVSRLQSSLIQSSSQGLLMDSAVLIEVDAEKTELLNRACFGHPIVTADRDKQWFQLTLEEAFYLCYSLKCIKVIGKDNCVMSVEELWRFMIYKNKNIAIMFKAYSHFRVKNWVVRPGSQYGVEFIAYRHHPALVHSEYAVLVLSPDDSESNGRLRVWSDFHCTLRLCGSVAKTLLVLYIEKHGKNLESPSCLNDLCVQERIINRWSPEQCREDQTFQKINLDQ